MAWSSVIAGFCRGVTWRISAGCNFVAQLSESGPDALRRDQTKRREGDLARQKGFAGAKRDRANLNYQLIKQPCVVELTDQFSAANEPMFLPLADSHLFMDWTYIATDERMSAPGIGASSRLENTQVG